MIKCITIDDTPLALSKLADFITQLPYLSLEREFTNAIDAISYLHENDVDLIFLDIQMEKLNGIQFMESLHTKPEIIITSAYSQYAIDGYEHNVADYLLKPYSFERFLKAVSKVQSRMVNPPKMQFMFVKSDYKMIKINFEDILYIEGKGAYLYIVSKQSRTMTLMTFAEIENILPHSSFLRIHKSYIIAINKIDSINGNTISINNISIPIGRTYSASLYQKLHKLPNS